MEGLNKIISLVLGLVVVVLFFAVVTGKINIKNKLSSLKITKAKKTTTKTLSPTKIPTPTPISTVIVHNNENTQNNNQNQAQQQTNVPDKIPATGLPTEMLAVLISSPVLGVVLKKIS